MVKKVSVFDDYFTPMTEDVKSLYFQMRRLENIWVEEIKSSGLGEEYFLCPEEQKGERITGKRQRLIVAHSLILPNTKDLRQIKIALAAKMKVLCKQDKYNNSGSRTTQMPQWCWLKQRFDVDGSIPKIEAASRVDVYRHRAFRGGELTLKEAAATIVEHVNILHSLVENAEKYRQQNRVDKYLDRLNSLVETKEIIKVLRPYQKKLSIRKTSGMSTKIRIHTDKLVWIETFPTVGLIFGSKKTQVIMPDKRKTQRKDKKISVWECDGISFLAEQDVHAEISSKLCD